MNISATVVTYNPNHDHIENIKKIALQFEKVFVVDNSEKYNEFINYLNVDNVFVIKNNTNLGIAAALNFGLKMAKDEGFEFCATFDQDSTIDNDFRNKMEAKLIECLDLDEFTVILAPNFFDRNSKSYAMFSKLTKWTCNNFRLDSSGEGLVKSSFAITSGSFVCLELFNEIGNYKEEYFIDHVDSEFCLRAQGLGYSIYIAPNVILNHSIGERTKHRLLGVTIKANNHSPQRRYFIIRNGIAMTVDNLLIFPSHVYLCFARLIHEFLAVVFFEDDKLKKLKAISYGVLDGLIKRFDNKFRY